MDPSRTLLRNTPDNNIVKGLLSATAASTARVLEGRIHLAAVSTPLLWTTAIARPRELIMEIRIGPAAVDVLVRTLASNFCRPSPNLYR